MTVKCVIWLLYLLKTNCYSVGFRGFTDCTTRKANRMAFVVSCKNQNNVIQVNCNQGKQNLVQVSGEFELSKYEFSE